MFSFLKELLTRQFIKDAIISAVFILALYAITHNPIVRPVPSPIFGNWSIQYMQHPLLLGFAGHNFLSLRDGEGRVISELHGLATDTDTGNWKYVGTDPKDVLHVWEFENGKYYLSGKTYPGIVLMQGKKEEVAKRWQEALACEGPINDQHIPYPPYGVRLRNETINSNSVAYTLAACMGLDTKHLGLWTPGSTVNLLEKLILKTEP
jgi:hypothetical protein